MIFLWGYVGMLEGFHAVVWGSMEIVSQKEKQKIKKSVKICLRPERSWLPSLTCSCQGFGA